MVIAPQELSLAGCAWTKCIAKEKTVRNNTFFISHKSLSGKAYDKCRK
jgi:hypothetical protein